MKNDKKNTLIFSNDGKEAHIAFANGSESLPFYYKEEVFKAITDLGNEQRITVHEFATMRQQVLENEKFPWVNSFFDHLKRMGESVEIIQMGLRIFGYDVLSKDLTEPVFGVCSEGKHGVIIFTKFGPTTVLSSGVLHTKMEAKMILGAFVGEKIATLSSECFQRLLQEIDSSTLS